MTTLVGEIQEIKARVDSLEKDVADIKGDAQILKADPNSQS